MTTIEPALHDPVLTSAEHDLERRRARLARTLSSSMTTVRSSAITLADHAPEAMRVAQVRVSEATSALQRLPDSTLRWLAAGSLGIAAGFQLAGAPRLIRVAGAAPALLMGAAIALRPTAHGVAIQEASDDAINQVEASVEGAVGALEEATSTTTTGSM